MEYVVPDQADQPGCIPCCECGTPIAPNPANMCVPCLRTRVDISEGIPKQSVLYFCKVCERYLQPPDTWISAALESRELLSVCLKKLKGLGKVRLIDASFIWTEPHSRRVKVKLTIQKEVLNGAILQQAFIVEYVVNTQMCTVCQRAEAKDYWKSNVQVRQKTTHKKTLLYLEQLILKHKAHAHCVAIKQVHNGIDFYFSKKDFSQRFVEFLKSVVPIRWQYSQTLISHDIQNNTYNYKSTFSVEIVPVCKDEVVCLSRKLAQSLGNMSQMALVQRVTQTIHLIDPATLNRADIQDKQFWKEMFSSIASQKQLIEFTVMDIDYVNPREQHIDASMGNLSQRHILADAWVVRSADLGMSVDGDDQIHCRTHLGHLLKPGDAVMGYDLRNSNANNDEFEKMRQQQMNIPDVILVKKVFGDRSTRSRRRKWKLKHLDREISDDGSSIGEDYEDFLEDLEEDKTIREAVNIYVDKDKMIREQGDGEEDLPEISLAEMMEDLEINDDPMGEADEELEEESD